MSAAVPPLSGLQGAGCRVQLASAAVPPLSGLRSLLLPPPRLDETQAGFGSDRYLLLSQSAPSIELGHSQVEPVHSQVEPVHSQVELGHSQVEPVHSQVEPVHSQVELGHRLERVTNEGMRVAQKLRHTACVLAETPLASLRSPMLLRAASSYEAQLVGLAAHRQRLLSQLPPPRTSTRNSTRLAKPQH